MILIKPWLTEIMPLNGGSQIKDYSVFTSLEPDGVSSFYCRMSARTFLGGFSNVAHTGI